MLASHEPGCTCGELIGCAFVQPQWYKHERHVAHRAERGAGHDAMKIEPPTPRGYQATTEHNAHDIRNSRLSTAVLRTSVTVNCVHPALCVNGRCHEPCGSRLRSGYAT